jgi:hypothetical protein
VALRLISVNGIFEIESMMDPGTDQHAIRFPSLCCHEGTSFADPNRSVFFFPYLTREFRIPTTFGAGSSVTSVIFLKTPFWSDAKVSSFAVQIFECLTQRSSPPGCQPVPHMG